MKKALSWIMVLMLALAAVGCGVPTEQTPEQTPEPTPEVIVFTDAVLEAKVRAAMDKPEGDITVAEAGAMTELNLSNEWQSQIPEETQIKDISSLKYFPNLTDLRMCFHAVSDISVLAEIKGLNVLDLGGNRISDISPLAFLAGLREISLFGNQISDISPLSKLNDLNYLHADRNLFTDLSPLAGLSKLTFLDISDSVIEDISPLAGLNSLTNLDLARNNITDISGLSGLPLTKLFLDGNPIEDYSPLADIYPNLVEKDFEILSADGIPDDPLVFGDPAFEKALRAAMGIFDRPITLKDAFLVQGLQICNDKSEGSQFSDISPLAHFPNLKNLYFNANKISDISPLSGLKKLINLDIGFNQVADLSPLSGLTQLKSLKLNNNQITDVSALSGLTNLGELWLKDNPVSDFSPLAGIYANLWSKDFEIK